MRIKSVNCLGIIVVDALSGPFDHYPIRKKEIQVNSPAVRFAVGGGAANSAAALARLGVPVTVFSKLGKDPNGAFALTELRRAGAATDGVREDRAGMTPFTFVGIHGDGDRTFVHTPGVNLSFSPRDLDPKLLFRGDFLFYQDHGVLPKLDGAPAARLLQQARRAGMTTFLDECWGLGPNPAGLDRVLPYADYFLPSYDDMLATYGRRTPLAMARLLHDKGVGKVVLKLGKRGCLLWDGAVAQNFRACSCRVVDTTGAGDCFDAGFIAALARGYDCDQACAIGHRAAAACVTRVGGNIGDTTFRELTA
ncbi:MAG: carbohydrate kinase family protein [Kiritimatiellae bacterium]|nr:carbohydrate kinase family protein [Kiritimatiellia bacterium]